MIQKIYNEDCEVTLHRMEDKSIDVLLTSPPYNIMSNPYSKNSKNKGFYDNYNDNLSKDEYIDWIIRLFTEFDRVLKSNGVVIWNASYGTNTDVDGCGVLWEYVAEIIHKTNFTVADKIVWKKKTAVPLNNSNSLTRICEDVFIFSRKEEMGTYFINKKFLYKSDASGANIYANVNNFVSAPNNDGSCPYNSATYSSDLCEKLLSLYAPISEDTVVYDPFMGTGTTAVACKMLNIGYIGSELSEVQCKWAENRLIGVKGTQTDVTKKSLF